MIIRDISSFMSRQIAVLHACNKCCTSRGACDMTTDDLCYIAHRWQRYRQNSCLPYLYMYAA